MRKWLKDNGYPTESPMARHISKWDGLYSAADDWYKVVAVDNETGNTYTRDRATLRPAKMVCQEWASLLTNERPVISCDSGLVNDWLESWVDNDLLVRLQELVERSFALGTGAAVLRVADGGLDVMRYSGEDIIPLSSSDRHMAEAIFLSTVSIEGKLYEQALMVTCEDGIYHSEPYLFDKGKRIEVEGYGRVAHGETPPFMIIRPCLSNPYDEHSPLGISIFDDGVDAVKQVDRVWDNMGLDYDLGAKMLFLPETMLAKTDDGKWISPTATGRNLMMVGEDDELKPYEYNPDLRVSQNRDALETALSVLSIRCGLGKGYYSISEQGVARTATEVMSQNSGLFRNLRKHEGMLSAGLSQLVRSAVETLGMGDPGRISVMFDDSVIEDTDSMKDRDRRDVDAGLMSRHEYRMKWYGEDEETARKAIEEIDGSFAL